MRALLDVPGPIDHVHQSVVLPVPADTTLAGITDRVARLLRKHDLLRARLVRDVVGQWVLEVPGKDAARPIVSRVDTETGLDAQAEAARLAPADGVMLRAVWLDRGPKTEGALLLVAHHLVVDAVSWRVIAEDLTGDGAPTTSFRRWARLLAARAEAPDVVADLDHWTALLRTPNRCSATAPSARATPSTPRACSPGPCPPPTCSPPTPAA
ncbi:condensation domain-containing protein [Actinokineospora soli]|uniref:Condensation domain-containing protein n=1 Tax=Actinokineospora soli TaxID=1048753 RepID=A0ABW2TRM3_9PSEU